MNSDNYYPLVSIVIPVYNAEGSLKRCLESIKQQIYQNIEVIVVNDGSTDGSKEICFEYSKKDERFTLINQNNQGSASARNAGIELSSGEYLAFIDSDDYVSPTFIKDLVETLQSRQSVLAEIDYYTVTESSVEINNDENSDTTLIPWDKAVIEIAQKKKTAAVWNKLFLSKIVKENRISFPNDIRFWEDMSFCFRYLLCTKSYVSYNMQKDYYYCISSASLTHDEKYRKDLSWVNSTKYVWNLIDHNPDFPPVAKTDIGRIYSRVLLRECFSGYLIKTKEDVDSLADELVSLPIDEGFLRKWEYSIVTKHKSFTYFLAKIGIRNILRKIKRTMYTGNK